MPSYEELYEEAPCGYLSLGPDGTVDKINRTLLRSLGRDAGEVVGKLRLQDLMAAGSRIYHATHCVDDARANDRRATVGRLLDGAVLAMAAQLGLRVVAEGVETEAQLAWLNRMGCDRVQGFLLGRPVSPPEMAELLRGAAPVANRAAA